jgi:arylsulfatase A-like enzyme
VSRTYKLLSVLFMLDELSAIPLRRRAMQAAALGAALAVLAFLPMPRRRKLLLAGVPTALLALGALASPEHGSRLVEAVRLYGGRLLLNVYVFHGDAIVLAAFGGLALYALAHYADRRALVPTLRGVTFLVLLAAGLDLAYYRSTGLLGDGTILKYWISNFRNVMFLVASGLDTPNVLIIATYALLVPLAWWLRSSEALARPSAGGTVVAAPFWCPLLAVALLCLAPAGPVMIYQYERISHQLLGSVALDLSRDATTLLHPVRLRTTRPLASFEHLTFAPKPERRPLNVVLFILESTRARSVTPYNPRVQNTPFLKSIADRGLLVDDMYTVVPHTARAWTAILTGLHPATGMISSWADADANGARLPSLPRLLRPFGYRSAFFTTAHTKFERDADVIKSRGFDTVHSDGDYDTSGFERNNYFGYEDRVMLKPSLAWIDETRAQGRPFFFTLMTLTGHHDYKVPSTFPKQKYADTNSEGLNDYLNCLHYVDDLIHTYFDELEKRDLVSSTLFVILGDHGESFGEHGPQQHLEVLYDEVLKIPGVLYAPALFKQPGHITGLRQEIDILPTIADALGFDIQGGYLPGQSMLAPVAPDRSLYFSVWREEKSLALRRGSTKYIYHFRREPIEMFDLASDPREEHDLGARLTDSESEKVEAELLAWQKGVGDTFLNGKQP